MTSFEHCYAVFPIKLDKILYAHAARDSGSNDCSGTSAGHIVEPVAKTKGIFVFPLLRQKTFQFLKDAERDQTSDPTTI